ncbi:MAG TPA: DUF1571 domain-containing protein [Pirellulaceae bacterium]|nr:DUF1571 domain-containing protein [Pirellulaceae bacterium]
MLIAVVALAMLAFLYYGAAMAWQHWLGERVDPNLNRLSSIELGEDDSANHIDLPGMLAGLSQSTIDAAEFPLDPVLEIASAAKQYIEENIRDYTSIMINQVRIGSRPIREEQFMYCKIRHRHTTAEGEEKPFSIYTRFVAPQNVLGQEAIWVEGQNNGKIIGHAAGLLNVARFWLDPEGPIAMEGNLHPMYQMGFARFLDILLEKGLRDRECTDCQVTLTRNITIDERPCLLLEVKHPEQKGDIDFHIARIYIDIGHQIPIGYEGYLWPEKPGDPPLLIEKYLYTQIQLNVGLTDADFDPDNPEYDFPGRKRR